jgi:hypothetical protein
MVKMVDLKAFLSVKMRWRHGRTFLMDFMTILPNIGV